MTYTELKGVPIFKSGIRRGERYSEQRIRTMVRNSNAMRDHFRGVLKVKLTHKDRLQPSLLHDAALGQSARYYLRRRPDGLYMMGDFTGVPQPVADSAQRHFPNVSVEKYRQFQPGDGSRVPDVVKSVAFLGADAPEVKGLRLAFPDVFQDDFGEIEVFQLGGDTPMKTITTYREKLSMTPEDLAAAVGMDAELLLAIEAGEQEPDDTQLAAIADALGVSVEDLTAEDDPEKEGEEEKTPPPQPQPFSEDDPDILRLINRAVAAAVKPLHAKVQALTVKANTAEKELFQERQTGKQRAIQATLKELFAPNDNGLALPAVLKEQGIEKFMESLDDRDVDAFAEGQPKTPLEMFTDLLTTVKTVGLVDTVERAGADYDKGDPDDPVAMIEHYAEEQGIDFATAASRLSKTGKVKV